MTDAVEIERLELGRVDDVTNRHLACRLRENVSSSRASRAGNHSRPTQPEQDLLDIVCRQPFLSRYLTAVDRAQIRSPGEVERTNDAVLRPRCDPHALTIETARALDKGSARQA